MNSRSDVSVVIPVFNGESFIVQTLSSVIGQTSLPLEIIIVDDGSQDNTCEAIEAFCKINPDNNIRLLRERHRGPGAARNAGVFAAKGSWIAFLDSDDLWFPDKLQRIEMAHNSMADANIICHNEVHRCIENIDKVIDYSLGFRSDTPLPPQLFSKNYFSTSAVVCRRDLILAYEGFDETLSNAQDYELWLRMSPSMQTLFVKDVLGVYVNRAGNISSGKIWRRYKNVLKVLHRHRMIVTKTIYLKSIIHTSAAYIYGSLKLQYKNYTNLIKPRA